MLDKKVTLPEGITTVAEVDIEYPPRKGFAVAAMHGDDQIALHLANLEAYHGREALESFMKRRYNGQVRQKIN